MDPSEIADLFFGPEDTATAKAQAMANALRGQQQLGQLGMLTGDKVLGGVGKQLFANAGEQQDYIPKAANMRLQRAMEAEKARREQEFQQAQMQHMGAQEQLQRDQMAQGRYTVLAPTANSPGYKVDGKRGIVTQILDAPPGAMPKALTENQQEKQWKDFTDAISTTRGRGNISLENQKRLYAGDRIRALAANPDGTPKDLSPNNMAELAMMSAALASGSNSPAQHSIESLTPKSVGSDFAKIKQWLSDEPQGANQQAFVKLMLEQAKREEDVIKPEILKAQLQAVPNYAHLSKKDAVRYQSLLHAAGIDPSTLDENGLEKVVQAAAGGGDSEMVPMIAPDGSKRLVPKARVQAAIAKGGKLANP